MRYEWDAGKAEVNVAKHGVLFDIVTGFDWSTAFEAEDQRYDYGEKRMQAVGMIGGRLHVLVYTKRADVIRVISLRKANRREMR